MSRRPRFILPLKKDAQKTIDILGSINRMIFLALKFKLFQ